MPMFLRPIVKMFRDGNVAVVGLRGRGKDMLMANVVMRRKLPYISNVDYGGDWSKFIPSHFDCGRNTYKNFLSGKVNRYVFPYPDGTDVYLSDAGVYFPAQHCNEINRDYGYFSTFIALSRHVGEMNFHVNAQSFNRIYDKFREQIDQFISCEWCKVICGIVFQKVIIYEKAQSAIDRVPVFPLPRPWFGVDRIQRWELAKAQYLISYGKITPRILIYRNRSNYDTRIFNKILENGVDPSHEKA